MRARRIRFLPGSRTLSKAALLSRTQLPEGPLTVTVVAWPLSRFVTFSFVPTGNVPLVAAGGPASPDSVTVDPGHTTSGAAALPAAIVATTPPVTRAPVVTESTSFFVRLIVRLRDIDTPRSDGHGLPFVLHTPAVTGEFGSCRRVTNPAVTGPAGAARGMTPTVRGPSDVCECPGGGPAAPDAPARCAAPAATDDRQGGDAAARFLKAQLIPP